MRTTPPARDPMSPTRDLRGHRHPRNVRRSRLGISLTLLAILWIAPAPTQAAATLDGGARSGRARSDATSQWRPAIPVAADLVRRDRGSLGELAVAIHEPGRGDAATHAIAVAEHAIAVGQLVAAARAAAAPPPQRSLSTAPTAAKPVAATPHYGGTNHLWFPALGYDRSVAFFSCSSSAYPANVVYRWGCAGANNVYLFGHAWGVMKPLHDAYVGGRLRVGMTVVYADASGRVRTYRITTWRLVRPEDSDWAMAAQPVPSMTLQTCVGANSEYRLVVRLVRAS